MQSAAIARLPTALASFVAQWLLVLICLDGLLPSASAVAQSSGTQPTTLIAFDIPAQPLDHALDAFGAASGLQIFYENSLTSGRRSTAVKGLMEPKRALQMLLWGSDLTGRVIAPGTVSVAAPDNASENSGINRPAQQAYLPYYGFLQAGVMKVLCGKKETRPGNYHIALQYWISPSGRIARFKLIGSSGSDERDAAIMEAIHDVVLPPPGEMPQPITMAIEPVQPVDCAPDKSQAGRGP